MRNIEREKTRLEKEVKKMKTEIKKMANNNQHVKFKLNKTKIKKFYRMQQKWLLRTL